MSRKVGWQGHGADDGLRQEVESLLRFEPASAGFLERPAAAMLAAGVTSVDGNAGLTGRTIRSYENVVVNWVQELKQRTNG